MSMLVNFSPDLKAWILHNLERGCAAEALVSAMIEQKFEPHVAHGLIDAFVDARNQGREPPAGSVMLDFPSPLASERATLPKYRYETPRLKPGSVISAGDRTVAVVVRAEQPVLAVLDGVLSARECDELIALSRPRLKPSTVVDPVTGEDKIAEHRDSDGMFFRLRENPFIAMLDARISALMGCPVENGEGLQILRYGPGAKNTPHYDFLAPSNQANRDSIARSGQRISSLVIYLNDVPAGGETVFPLAGLSVVPKKGNAVYFEYANSLQQLDHASLHAGATIEAGEKWVATKWMREKRYVSA